MTILKDSGEIQRSHLSDLFRKDRLKLLCSFHEPIKAFVPVVNIVYVNVQNGFKTGEESFQVQRVRAGSFY